MGSPVFRDALTEQTEIRLAYDDEYRYVAAGCFDPEPDKTISTTLSRDGTSPSDNSFGLWIDTFNDSETGVLFVVNSATAFALIVMSNILFLN